MIFISKYCKILEKVALLRQKPNFMTETPNSIEEALYGAIPNDDGEKISFEPGVIDGGLSAQMCELVRGNGS